MELRSLIAYLLIAVVVGIIAHLYRGVIKRRRDYRRNMQGLGHYKHRQSHSGRL